MRLRVASQAACYQGQAAENRSDLDGKQASSYSPAAMIARIAALFLLIALVVLPLAFAVGADAPETPSKPPLGVRHYLILPSGEVFAGEVSKDGENYVVVDGGKEVRFAERDVEMVCQNLDDAYQVWHARMQPGELEDHLRLAEWCVRNRLFGYAAHEIASAMQIDPKNRKAQLLDGRLQLEMTAKAEPKSETTGGENRPLQRALPATPAELDRLVKCLPGGAVENFTSIIQPMLVNSCATAGCHGPSSVSSFTLIRTSQATTPVVRITQRNLHSTIQWIDNEHPADSKLLIAAREPHGNRATPVASLDAAKYQELLCWVTQVAQRSEPQSNVATGNARHIKPLHQKSAAPYSPPGSLGSAAPLAASINPRAVFNPPAQRVVTTRPNAAPQSGEIPVLFNSAPTVQPATTPAQFVQPQSPSVRPPVTVPARPSTNSDEIPHANQVLPGKN